MSESIHLMGVGGVGMAAVAELEAARGASVSGCDGRDSATLRRLAGLGVRTRTGHDPAHLDGVDRLVVSSAIREDNPELAAARRRPGLTVQHRSQALAALTAGRRLVAVAGTHGKTTTSAMIVTALEAAGFEPSYAIGSELTGRGSGARLGGDIWVIEADESDGSFLNYSPELAVVTNIEFDHADFYPDPEAYFEAFAAFAGRIRPSGRLIACAADKGADALMERLRAAPSGPAVTAYGAAGGWRDLGLAGDHLALNAEAAGLAAQAFGADPALVRAGLAAFAGAARRFEPRGRAGGVAVYDDYAHHPTEIAATLAAARRLAGTSGRLLVVFQPHLYSRTKQFAAAFGRALGAADRVWLLDVYGAREAPMAGVDSGLIASAMPGGAAALARDRAAVPPAVAAAARPGDIVLTMGAGDVTELGPAIVAELEARG